jgi:hypothetical protein
LDKRQKTTLSLLLLCTPWLAYSDDSFSKHAPFSFEANLPVNTPAVFLPYRESNVPNSPSFFDKIEKNKSFNFETAMSSGSRFDFDYPDNLDDPVNDYISDINQSVTFQNSRIYKMIPKDLMPYLGLRVKYNFTPRIGVVNDITPHTIFYGLTYMY